MWGNMDPCFLRTESSKPPALSNHFCYFVKQLRKLQQFRVYLSLLGTQLDLVRSLRIKGTVQLSILGYLFQIGPCVNVSTWIPISVSSDLSRPTHKCKLGNCVVTSWSSYDNFCNLVSIYSGCPSKQERRLGNSRDERQSSETFPQIYCIEWEIVYQSVQYLQQLARFANLAFHEESVSILDVHASRPRLEGLHIRN